MKEALNGPQYELHGLTPMIHYMHPATDKSSYAQWVIDGYFLRTEYKDYRRTSNKRHSKSQAVDVSRLVFQLPLPNPLKTDVKSKKI